MVSDPRNDKNPVNQDMNGIGAAAGAATETARDAETGKTAGVAGVAAGAVAGTNEESTGDMHKPERVPYTRREIASLRLRRGIRAAILLVLFTIIIVGIFNYVVTVEEQVVNGVFQTTSVAERIDRYVSETQDRELTYADEMEDTLRTVLYMVGNDPSYQENDLYLERLQDKLNVTGIIVMDHDGNILVGSGRDTFTEKLKDQVLQGIRTPSYVAAEDDLYCAVAQKSGDKIYALTYWKSSVTSYIEESVYMPDLREEDTMTIIAVNENLNDPMVMQKGKRHEDLSDEEVLEIFMPVLDGMTEEEGFKFDVIEDEISWVHCVMSGYTTVYTIADGEAMFSRSAAVVTLTILLTLILLLWAAFYFYQLLVTQIDVEEGVARTKRTGNTPKKLFVMVLIITVVMILATAYLQVLYALSFSGAKDSQSFVNVAQASADGDKRENRVEYGLSELYMGRASAIGELLNNNPALQTEAELKKLAKKIDAVDVAIYDNQGKVITSVSGLLGNLSMTDEAGAMARKGLRKGEIFSLPAEYENGTLVLRTAAPLLDSDGYADGFVMLYQEPTALGVTQEEYTVNHLLEEMVVDGAGVVFAVNGETKEITYATEVKYIGMPAEQVGFKESLLAGDLFTFAKIDGEQYLVTSAEVEGQYLYSCKLLDVMILNAYAASWVMGILILISVLLVLYAMRSRRKDETRTHVVRQHSSKHTRISEALKAARESFEKTVDWKHGSAELEMSNVMRLLLAVFFFVLFVMVMNPDKYFPRNSIVHYILEGSWKRGFNILAVTSALITAIKFLVIVAFIRMFLNYMLDNLTAKGRTIVHTFSSFLQYLTIFYLILHFIELMGANPMAVMTSAGIGLATVGLGAKDAISDIISGLFIIFEKEYQVGDVVTVNGFTGVIQDMNVRTIRLKATDGNVMIVNNRNVSNVINKTMLDSVGQITYVVDNKTDFANLKKVMDEELPKLCRDYPGLTSEPKLVGISNADGYGTTIMILISCHEADRLELMSRLRMRIQVILQENGFM